VSLFWVTKTGLEAGLEHNSPETGLETGFEPCRLETYEIKQLCLNTGVLGLEGPTA